MVVACYLLRPCHMIIQSKSKNKRIECTSSTPLKQDQLKRSARLCIDLAPATTFLLLFMPSMHYLQSVSLLSLSLLTYAPLTMYEQADILSADLIVFVVATTGQGSSPAAMKPFWSFLLRSDLPSDLLTHLAYAVLALGDSSYPKFCWPGKKLSRRLTALGAFELLHRGEADDQDYLG